MKTAVYGIFSPTGKVYIGQSRVVENRWRRHKESKRTSPLYNSLRKHGWRTHKFQVLHELPVDVSQDVLNEYEQIYLDAFKDASFPIMNIRQAGSIGRFSEEHKKSLSDAHKGCIPWNKGVKGSQEAWNKGKKYGVKNYLFSFNGSVISIGNLKQYCIENELQYTSMIHLNSGTGYYGKTNNYKGYSKL